MMNGPHQKPAEAHEAPQRPRVFTIAALNRLSHGGISRCAPVPFLRLSGQWMAQYGFRIGSRVVVTAEDGRLVITLAGHASREHGAGVARSHSHVRGSDACDAAPN